MTYSGLRLKEDLSSKNYVPSIFCVLLWTAAPRPHPPAPSSPCPELLSFLFFEQAVHQPPPWQHVELRLPAGSSFHCPCLSLCGLISPDELSQPQRGAQCLLNRNRYLYCAAVMGTHWTGTLPPSPPPIIFFHPVPATTSSLFQSLFCLSIIQKTAILLSGSVSTLLCPGSYDTPHFAMMDKH